MKKLIDAINAKPMELGHVWYLHEKLPITIGDYENLKPYSAQVKFGDTPEVGFMWKGHYMVIFSGGDLGKKEYRDSYDKYRGLIYIYEPLTEDIENVLLSIII